MGDDYNFYNELTSIMDISGIVHNEQSRIDKKATGISDALDSQNRMIFLNQSYTNRMKEYSFMIMIIAMTILIIVFILAFQNYLPAALVNIIILIIGAVGGIWALWVYLGILNRDNVDFDKVYSIPPTDSSGNATVFSNADTDNNSAAMQRLLYGQCYGSECCGSLTTYDTISGQCFPSGSNFTSIEQAYNNGELSNKLLQNYNFMKSSLIFSSYP
jgi:hypothetical protein